MRKAGKGDDWRFWGAGRRYALGLKASLHSTTLHCVSLNPARARRVVWSRALSGESAVDATGYLLLAKHADVSFTIFELIEVEMELGSRRVNVNGIAPGLIKRERTMHEVSEEVVRAIVATIPSGRPGSPDDIAHAAMFLASRSRIPSLERC
jgi:hypothetical protein